MSDDVDLTSEEKMAFDKLPREAEPSKFLEERIVRTLREDGILRSAVGSSRAAPDTAGSPASHRRREVAVGWGRPWLVAVGSMAASLVLFGSGVFMGQWMGSRSTERALLAVRQQDSAQLAQRVQEAGSAYVSALVALSELQDSARPGTRSGNEVSSVPAASEIQQGREVALGALYGAALELARMTPGDSDVSRILRILEERRFGTIGGGGARRTVWY